MARAQKKFHYIYKTICNITGRYYIGMHSTANLNDGYMGSGKRLRYSLRKYGVENHTKEILEFLDDRDSLVKRESEIVNEGLINDHLCMNLKPGGSGGFSEAARKLGTQRMLKNIWNDPLFIERKRQQMKTVAIRLHEEGKIKRVDWTGKKHTKESKDKMSASHKGKRDGVNNSQHGTCWITDGTKSKKIHNGDIIPDGWVLGRKI